MKINISPKQNLNLAEFIALMATLMSMAALAIDAMLPALPTIGAELGVINPNYNQFIITSVFIGLSVGMIFYGPISDTFGRRRIICSGILCFLFGSLLSYFALSFEVMLIGRFLQGLGAASTRVVSIAMIRDLYSGNQMAKTMSLINMVFILVPTIAPSLGAFIISFAHWRSIFLVFFVLGIFNLCWLIFRQPETLPPENRKPITFAHYKKAIRIVFSTPQTIGYGIASGLNFGAFLGYLLSSQQIFENVFQMKKEFPLIFGGLALAIGLASFINSKLVEKLGMAKLTKIATIGISIFSLAYLAFYMHSGFQPHFISFMIFLVPTFMCVGILFGNFNSLALTPMGEIAGMATSVISTVNNAISLTIGSIIGGLFAGTLTPLIFGFVSMSILTTLTIIIIEKKSGGIIE